MSYSLKLCVGFAGYTRYNVVYRIAEVWTYETKTMVRSRIQSTIHIGLSYKEVIGFAS